MVSIHFRTSHMIWYYVFLLLNNENIDVRITYDRVLFCKSNSFSDYFMLLDIGLIFQINGIGNEREIASFL